MTKDDHDRRIPKLDSAIRKAAEHDMLVLFVGAGVSRLVGCKGWDELALNLVDRCYRERLISFRAVRELKSLTDHRQLITTCYHIMQKNNAENSFRDELERALKPDEDKFKRFGRIFDYLTTMQHLCIVTTNADANLDTCFPDKTHVVAKPEEFPSEPQAGFLYHLHGSMSEGNEIFTLMQYFDLYHKDRHNIQAFLEFLFGECQILFVGYGLSEFELLEFIFKKPKSAHSTPYRHFMLIDDSADAFRGRYLQSYYRDMGIKLISYNSDICGYDQLYYVIKEWSGQLQSAPQYVRLTDDQEQLRKLATQTYDKTDAQDAWRLLQRQDLQPFFFDTLSDSSHDIRRSWLRPLSKHGFFSPAHHPSLGQPHTSGSPGEVFWTPIGYLHRTVESAVKSRDTKTLSTIANIGATLIQVLIKEPSRTYDWRTNHFILQALTVDRKTLSQPDVYKATQNLMIAASTGLSFRMAVSDDLVTLLVQQRNRVAIEMIVTVFLHGMASSSGTAQNNLVGSFEKTFVPRAADLVRVCGLEIVHMCAASLRSWQRGSRPRTTTYYEVRSIEESSQSEDQGDSTPMAIVRFIRGACDQLPSTGLKTVVEQFLAPRAPSILRRIGYYLVNMHYDTMAPLFWIMKRNPLSDEDAFHEVFMLLSSHASSMNSKQVEIVLQWLKEAGSTWGRGIGLDNAEKKSLRHRFTAKWLLSLKTSRDTRVQALFKANWMDHTLPEHPEWNLYIGEAEREDAGVVTAPVLQGFETNDQLAAFLNTTAVSDSYSALRDMVSSDPERLVGNGLTSLLGIPVDLLQAVFGGLATAKRDKRNFPMKPALEFAELALIRLATPSKDASMKENRRAACRSISEFVSLTAKDEGVSWPGDGRFPEHLATQLIRVASKYPVTDPGLREPRWRLGSSALAAAVEAVIWVAWNLTETTRQSGQSSSRLPEWVAKLLDETVKYTDPNLQVEAREGIAAHLYVLNIVGPDWVQENLSHVFPKELPDQWRDAFSAYLVAPVYKELFLLLRDQGIYSSAIEHDFLDDNEDRHLAAHVSLAYISDLDGELMDAMLAHGGRGRLSEVIWYFANRDREWTDKGREKLLQLWPRMIKAIRQLSDQDDRTKLMSELPTWLKAFQELPVQAEDLLEASFDSWERHYSASESDILELLARSVSQDAKRVGNLLLSALHKDVVLMYPEEALTKTVETLCDKGLLDMARKIHLEYSNRGVWILLPVLKKWERP
ncbi:MAG: SIR2 family protein [Patescibacteria group bacterium]